MSSRHERPNPAERGAARRPGTGSPARRPLRGRHEAADPAVLAAAPEPHLMASTEIEAENAVALGREAAGSSSSAGGRDSDVSVMRTGGSIAIATLASRITGFVRTVLVLAMLGGVASAFQAAYVLPNMIAEVVLGAVLTAIVIPVLVRAETEDDDGGEGFINRIFTLTLVILGVATVAALIAAPLLTALNVGDGKVDRSLTTALAYLLLPEILFYGLSALFMAILNMKNVFKPGAWAPVLNNIVQIVTLALYVVVPGDITVNPLAMSDPKLLVLGIGTTLGVVVQAVILLPYLKRVGVRLRLQWGIDARLRRFGNMAVAIVGYVLILQVGMVITYRIAAAATETGIAVYATAWQMLQLPYGVLGVTILTAIMPRLSRNAAADDTDAVIGDMSLATRLTMLALVPTVVYMTFFGPAIGVAVFNFGRFDAADASQLGSVLAWGAFTLIPYAMTLVQLRVFYAREDAWTPTVMVLGITAVKVVASYLGPVLFGDPEMVVRWLGFANGLGYLVGAIVGHYLLHRRLGRTEMMRGVTRTTLSTVGVSLGVTGAVWALAELSSLSSLATRGKLESIGYLALTGIVVLGVVYLLLVALRIPDMVTISDSIRRLLGRFVPRLAPAQAAADAGDDDLDATTMTVQFPRIGSDEGVPYSGQVEVRRRFDRGSASWHEYAVTSGGAAGETMVLPRIGADPRDLPRPLGDRRGPASPPGAAARPPGGHPPVRPPTAQSSAARPPTPGPVPMSQNPSAPPRGPRLVPGAVVAGGRYRLLEAHGGARGLQFWRAQDTRLPREVGLTFVDPEQQAPPHRPDDPAGGPQAVLDRTRRLGQVQTAGVARVLDVVRGASGGIVVTEWVPGSSLAEAAAAEPSATGAARAVRALAAAAESAHRAGAALSIDHPDRIRISTAGDAVLAFPAVLDGDDQASDVRGLGAVLYALLLNRWPLDGADGHRIATAQAQQGAVGGLPPAAPDLQRKGLPVAPMAVKPGIPFEISTVTMRALEGGGAIRTAGTVQHVLDQATVVNLATDVIPRTVDDAPPVSVAPLSRTRKERLLGEGEAGRRNTALLFGGALLTLFLVVALVLWLGGVFSSDDESDLESFLPETGTSAPASPTRPAPTPVAARAVTVLDPQGEKDWAAQQNAANVLTGAAPPWQTSQYRGSGQFGGLKEGLGLMFRFEPGTTVTQATFETATPGIRVEFRTSAKADPNVNATSIVGAGTVGRKTATLRFDAPAQTRYLLVWITGLPEVEPDRYQAVVSKIAFAG